MKIKDPPPTKPEEKPVDYWDFLVSDSLGENRELLDKMFDRISDKYGEFLWK